MSFAGLEPYKVKVTGLLRAGEADDVEQARRELAAALLGGGVQDLVLPYMSGLSLKAAYAGEAELARPWIYPNIELEFLVTDPVAYGEQRTATIGTSYTTVKGGGTAESWPIIQATPGSGSYWRVYCPTTGKYVRVDTAFDGTQKVVVDMEAMRCTVNGSDHAVTIGSDFFPLGTGSQYLYVSSGTAEMTWKERWL